MSIRARLILVSLLVAVPAAGLITAYLTAVRLHDSEGNLVAWVDGRLRDPLFRVRCQSGQVRIGGDIAGYVTLRPAPEGQPGASEAQPSDSQSGPFRLFVFDETLQKPFPAAAIVPRQVLEGLAAGAGAWLAGSNARPLATFYSGPGLARWYVKGTGWGGTCAFIVATSPIHAHPNPLDLWPLPILVGVVFIAALVSGGPIVRRVRDLTRAVRESSEAGYEHPIPVDGRDEFAALARTFNEAGAGLRDQLTAVADREATLREFVANTGHDVATPLSVLQGHLSALESRVDLPAAARADVAAAIRETHFAGSILRNLAAMAKLDTPGWIVALAPLDLVSLVERVVARHQPLARASGVEIAAAVPAAPVIIEADATLLEQALSNLVDNAVRYNRPGGHVGVSLDRDADHRFVVRVIDDGPGVTDVEMAALGMRDFRSDEARSRRPDGQGLGLDIACSVVRRLGFSIDFRRSEAGGLAVDIVGAG